MKCSTPQDKNLAGGTKAQLHPPKSGQGGKGRAMKPNRFAKRANRLALCLALVCLGLLFTSYPFRVEGKKEHAQAQVGEVQVQGTQVEGVTSAVVDFEELAIQQALNPEVSDPMPKTISPPRTIDEVDVKNDEIQAPAANAPVDLPGPLIPSPAPANNFAALNDIPFAPPGTAFFTIPPDTMGAVGRDSVNKVFVTLNNNYRVQNKTTGVQIGSDVSMTNFWAPVGANSPFDPRVQYDPYNDRWILAAVSDAGAATAAILVGVSLTNDPAGLYFLSKIPARIVTDPVATNFADFPMLGFNKNWVVVSINMFASAFTDGRSLVIDYPTLRTGSFVGTYFTGVSAGNAGFCMHPATTYSATEGTEYLVAHQSSAGASYRMHTITGTPGAPIFTVGALMVRPGGGWTQPSGNILPQAMGTCATTPMKMEVGDAFVRSNVVFRNNGIWYTQTVGIPAGGLTHTASQWTQLNTAGAVIQGGRVEDPTATATNGGKWYAYASIAVNSSDDVLLGFSQFSSTQFASSGYTYHDRTDAAGTMRDPVIFKAGEDCYSKDFGSGRNRWGDYSHTMVDPTDDCSFWTIQEYAKLQAPPTIGGSSSKWGTWWARVNPLVSCAPLPPVLNAAGVTLVNESCPPFNSAADPGERVSVNLAVTSNGGSSTTNLVGTLQASGNVLAPDGARNYGVIAPGGTASRTFSFTANGTCGQTITLTLQLQDGTTNFGTVTYSMVLGSTQTNPPATFSNSTPITIPGTGTSGAASPYPSSIAVAGLTGTISKVTVTLKNLSHTFAADVGMLLVGPGGQKFVIIDGVNGFDPWVDITYTLDDAAATLIPSSGTPASGAYKPTSYFSGDIFPAPAPPGLNQEAAPAGSATFASVFNGANPNGTWSLYVFDFAAGDSGTMAGGWELNITTKQPACSSCTQARLVMTQTLRRVGAEVEAAITVQNQGITTATAVTLTQATLSPPTNNGALPPALGDIGPGASVTTTVTFTNPGTGNRLLKMRGTYDGSSMFGKSQLVVLP